jgi:ribonuclease HII
MIAPVVVRLLRKGNAVFQGCDVYIGQEWRKGGWNLPESQWVNPFRITVFHDSNEIMKRYESLVRDSQLFAQLDTLSGKVLGCWCKMPDEERKTCHGDVLVKLWKEVFPEHVDDPDLWKKHYYPEGQVLGKRAQPKSSALKEPQPKKDRKLYRDQSTHPDGLKFEGELNPWPSVSIASNEYSIYVDEAGMGCLAGPLHIGGTVLLPGFAMQGIHDSKLLKEHEREKRYDELLICPQMLHHVEIVSNVEIDKMHLGQAWRYGIRKLVKNLIQQVKDKYPQMKLTQIILDGNKTVDDIDLPVHPHPKADRLFAGVAAASILAKVSRDRYMISVAPQYPGFDEIFAHGQGYMHSVKHSDLIKAGKYTDLHRKSYNPLRDLLEHGHLKRVKPLPAKSNSPIRVLTLKPTTIEDD